MCRIKEFHSYYVFDKNVVKAFNNLYDKTINKIKLIQANLVQQLKKTELLQYSQNNGRRLPFLHNHLFRCFELAPIACLFTEAGMRQA